jgi:hypothetical protein
VLLLSVYSRAFKSGSLSLPVFQGTLAGHRPNTQDNLLPRPASALVHPRTTKLGLGLGCGSNHIHRLHQGILTFLRCTSTMNNTLDQIPLRRGVHLLGAVSQTSSVLCPIQTPNPKLSCTFISFVIPIIFSAVLGVTHIKKQKRCVHVLTEQKEHVHVSLWQRHIVHCGARSS